ncbi:MAG: hypothetical protein K9G49_03030 [Taibaiella sp.]|nr:hypothetical protein [Taibaiella sp.]
MRTLINRYIVSLDTIVALIAVIMACIFLPDTITNKFCTTVYGMAINVLAIVFSIFFASLAVIMSFPDNEFIRFIEAEDKLFSQLLGYFRDTLFALFVSLVSTIIIYIITAYLTDTGIADRKVFIFFCFIFTYSLVSTITAVDVALKITGSRATYLINRKEPKSDSELDSEEVNE